MMINSTFNISSAKDAINQANSKHTIEASAAGSFREKAMQELEYFSDFVTGGFYEGTKFKKAVHMLSDNA